MIDILFSAELARAVAVGWAIGMITGACITYAVLGFHTRR